VDVGACDPYIGESLILPIVRRRIDGLDISIVR